MHEVVTFHISAKKIYPLYLFPHILQWYNSHIFIILTIAQNDLPGSN